MSHKTSLEKSKIYVDSNGLEFGRLYVLKPKQCPNGHTLYCIGKDEKCCDEDCQYGIKD